MACWHIGDLGYVSPCANHLILTVTLYDVIPILQERQRRRREQLRDRVRVQTQVPGAQAHKHSAIFSKL